MLKNIITSLLVIASTPMFASPDNSKLNFSEKSTNIENDTSKHWIMPIFWETDDQFMCTGILITSETLLTVPWCNGPGGITVDNIYQFVGDDQVDTHHPINAVSAKENPKVKNGVDMVILHLSEPISVLNYAKLNLETPADYNSPGEVDYYDQKKKLNNGDYNVTLKNTKATIFNGYGMPPILLFYDDALNGQYRGIFGAPFIQNNQVVGIFGAYPYKPAAAGHLPFPEYRKWIIQEAAPKIYGDQYSELNTVYVTLHGTGPKGMSVKVGMLGTPLGIPSILDIDSNGNWSLPPFPLPKTPHGTIEYPFSVQLLDGDRKTELPSLSNTIFMHI